MSTPETDLIPHYGLYSTIARLSEFAIGNLGGYTPHNVEALRAVEGQAAIVAPNHRANIDSFVLGLALHYLPKLTEDSPHGPLQTRPVHYMAKDSLAKYPLVRNVVEGCGAFFVERYKGIGLKPEQVEHVGNLVSHNALMCIYPEGTRRGEDVDHVLRERLKTSIAFLALKHGLPLIPTGIAGADNFRKLPRHVVFNDPIWVKQNTDIESSEFQAQKVELMNLLHLRIDEAYVMARGYLLDDLSSRQVSVAGTRG